MLGLVLYLGWPSLAFGLLTGRLRCNVSSMLLVDLFRWIMAECPTLAASALYCAATVRLVAVSYKLYWSYNFVMLGVACVCPVLRNLDRPSRVTLVTNNRYSQRKVCAEGEMNTWKDPILHVIVLVAALLAHNSSYLFHYACLNRNLILDQFGNSNEIIIRPNTENSTSCHH